MNEINPSLMIRENIAEDQQGTGQLSVWILACPGLSRVTTYSPATQVASPSVNGVGVGYMINKALLSSKRMKRFDSQIFLLFLSGAC